MSNYKWVYANEEQSLEQRLFNVGIENDGSLHNPNGYPEDLVRSAVMAADARGKERRSQAAKKAGATRKLRTAKKVYSVARHLTLNGVPIGPRNSCVICGRGLGDQQSIGRGIGSECWQSVLDEIERLALEKPAQMLLELAGVS